MQLDGLGCQRALRIIDVHGMIITWHAAQMVIKIKQIRPYAPFQCSGSQSMRSRCCSVAMQTAISAELIQRKVELRTVLKKALKALSAAEQQAQS